MRSFSCIKGIKGIATTGSCDNKEAFGQCNLQTYKQPDHRCKFCPDTKQDIGASLMGFQNIEKVMRQCTIYTSLKIQFLTYAIQSPSQSAYNLINAIHV